MSNFTMMEYLNDSGQVGRVQLEEWIWSEIPSQILQCTFPDTVEAKFTPAAGGKQEGYPGHTGGT